MRNFRNKAVSSLEYYVDSRHNIHGLVIE